MRTTNPAKCGGLESTQPITMSGSGKVKRSCRLPMESFRKAVAAPTEIIKNGASGWQYTEGGELWRLYG